jgi:hypothetical protein
MPMLWQLQRSLPGAPYQARWADAVPQAGQAVHANCAAQCGQRARVSNVSNQPPQPSGLQYQFIPFVGTKPQTGHEMFGRGSPNATDGICLIRHDPQCVPLTDTESAPVTDDVDLSRNHRAARHGREP